MDIKGKVALVTGAGSGIGRATAVRLVREGASVVVADVNEDGGAETVRMIQDAGGRAAFVRADVTNADDVRAMVSFAETTFGGLDILHNNAGIGSGQPRFPMAEPERWQPVLDVNLRGVILGTQYAIPAMRKRGAGAIVNTASMAGVGYGFPPDPVYSASKGGVVLFTASLATLKAEANIRVNCVCPGIVDTPMLRAPRDGRSEAEQRALDERLQAIPVLQPEDIADAVVALVHDESAAGQAMWVRNGVPPQLQPLPDARGMGRLIIGRTED
jgi:NAD(P)-dependent dehydrogenase (short-subunit alcohol dehydrogenase family)